MVTQETAMFNRSALDNILYGRPDAGREAAKDAAKEAQADEFIAALQEEAEESPDPTPDPTPVPPKRKPSPLEKYSDAQLAAELQRRGWVVMEP